MKTLFVIIGIVVIFGILISSGGVGAGICVNGVGCIRTEQGGVKIDQTDTNVTINTEQRP